MSEEGEGIKDAVVEAALDLGFQMPSRVEVDDLPDDVTILSNEDLAREMSRYTSMIAYAASQAAVANAEAEAMKARYKEQRARRWIELRDMKGGKKYSNGDIEAILDCDDELVGYKKEQVYAEGFAKMVQALLSGYEGKYALLSRELTRRGLAERHFD